jgi:hypothetical protein
LTCPGMSHCQRQFIDRSRGRQRGLIGGILVVCIYQNGSQSDKSIGHRPQVVVILPSKVGEKGKNNPKEVDHDIKENRYR